MRLAVVFAILAVVGAVHVSDDPEDKPKTSHSRKDEDAVKAFDEDKHKLHTMKVQHHGASAGAAGAAKKDEDAVKAFDADKHKLHTMKVQHHGAAAGAAGAAKKDEDAVKAFDADKHKLHTMKVQHHGAAAGAAGAAKKDDDDEPKMQSPVDLKDIPNILNNGSELFPQMEYNATHTWEAINSGQVIEVDADMGSLDLPKGVFYFDKFVFHFPSEHTIDNQTLAGEMQVVHKLPNGSAFTIVSILLEEGDENPFFTALGADPKSPLWPPPPKPQSPLPSPANPPALPLPTVVGDSIVHNGTLDFAVAFEDQLKDNFFTYSGSLTLPPYTENVDWYVMQKTAEISAEQIKIFMAAIGDKTNARPTMDLNCRTVCFNVLVDECPEADIPDNSGDDEPKPPKPEAPKPPQTPKAPTAPNAGAPKAPKAGAVPKAPKDADGAKAAKDADGAKASKDQTRKMPKDADAADGAKKAADDAPDGAKSTAASSAASSAAPSADGASSFATSPDDGAPSAASGASDAAPAPEEGGGEEAPAVE